MQKILCLHGYRQNGTVFKDRTGSLRKLLKKHAELVYITAPHLVPAVQSDSEQDQNGVEQRGWWFSKPELTFNSHDITDFSFGLEESLQEVEKAFETLGPFDGILGFSQGASLAAILCHLQDNNKLKYSFKFAILVAGFKSRASLHNHFYANGKSRTLTLHVIGETDRIVEKEMSEELTKFFDEPAVLVHGGGHYVPASSKEKEGYTSFLLKFEKQ